jgi:hypothetical protein
MQVHKGIGEGFKKTHQLIVVKEQGEHLREEIVRTAMVVAVVVTGTRVPGGEQVAEGEVMELLGNAEQMIGGMDMILVVKLVECLEVLILHTQYLVVVVVDMCNAANRNTGVMEEAL